ncbi:DUF1624 domain-containing protein [Desulfovibrio subterraneus]|uniref:DUF1624 domain-containing protein n=1 Tax=Desulfovibrio subterraneus TaxID=2718620 RepID=UPI00157B1C49|nr:heparan-alpha-glucosaminide N-acetyltransferase domain-containing protein [Desulfovibrio subterraneus]
MKRLPAIDTVRGIVIVLMILDHTRFFFSPSIFSPTDLQHTTPALFTTRWITHIAAVAFILLAGASAHLYGLRHGERGTRPFLLRRGVFIAMLELSLVKFCWNYRMDFSMTYLQVIWAIGWSMVLLACVISIPRLVGFSAALCCILSQYIAPAITGRADTLPELLSALLCIPGTFVLPHNMAFHTSYPVLPWFGLMWIGYLGAPVLLARSVQARRKLMAYSGLACFALFAVIRWQCEDTSSLTAFLNVQKYPPQADYLLVTTGLFLFLYITVEYFHEHSLSLLNPTLSIFNLFGKAPLVIYMIHLFFLQILRNAINWYPSVFNSIPIFNTTPEGLFHLSAVYFIAALTSACMLPIALLFIRTKNNTSRTSIFKNSKEYKI